MAAPLAANIVLPGVGGSIVSGLMDEVLDDAQINPAGLTEEAKAQAIAQDPKLLAALKTKAMDLEAKQMEEQTKNMQEVGTTQRAELTNGKWYQRAWRPWNGFLFPLAIIGVYIVVPIAKVMLLAKYPMLAMADVDIPEFVFIAWAGVLGVAVYGRNQEKKGAPGAIGMAKGLISKLIKK